MPKNWKNPQQRAKNISKALIGKKRSEESKKKMSEIKKGIKPKNLKMLHNLPRTKKWRDRVSKTNKKTYKKKYPKGRIGKIAANWQGGITPKNFKIRNSKEYVLWRKAIFERDNYTCQRCLKNGGRLEVHHILPFAKYPELRLAINNGLTLCKKCHKNL